MAVDPRELTIVHYPDPVLHKKAAPIEKIDEDVRAVAARMIELMHEAEGVGLAAPQVGLSWRMFVVSARESEERDRVFVNPRLRITDPEPVAAEEGCLSLPGLHVEVRRARAVEMTATTLDGEDVTLQAEDFLARILQHEFDHIEGKLIIDRMSPMARLATRKTLKEMRAGAVNL